MTTTLAQAISGLADNPQRMKAIAESINGTQAQQQAFRQQIKANFGPVANGGALLARWGLATAGSIGLSLQLDPALSTYLRDSKLFERRLQRSIKKLNR